MMRRLRAFTIMELVIGMIISGLVLAIAYGGYSLVLRQFMSYRSLSGEISRAAALHRLLTLDFAQPSYIRYQSAELVVEAEGMEGMDTELARYRFGETSVIREQAGVRDTFPFPVSGLSSYRKGLPAEGYIDELVLECTVTGQKETLRFSKSYSAEQRMHIEKAANDPN
jgi:hypothetical protein